MKSIQRELAPQVVVSRGKISFGQLVHGDDDPVVDRFIDAAGSPLIKEGITVLVFQIFIQGPE